MYKRFCPCSPPILATPATLFICGKSLKGNFLLHRKSRGDRMRAKLQEIQEELRQRRHQAIPLQGEWLRSVVSGYFNYHAVPTNGRALTVFHTAYYVTGTADLLGIAAERAFAEGGVA
jgi:hypothetical protein